MTDDFSPSENKSAIPEEFLNLVKLALEKLYDLPYLQNHPLAKDEFPAQVSLQDPPGHRLRKEIISAIETLNPGKNVFFRQPQARIYHLMHMHYVAGMMVQEAANELGISKRQAYRDLREGEASVAIILWERRQPPDSIHPPEGSRSDVLRQEITRIAPNFRLQEFNQLVENARKTVERLARQRGLEIEFHLPNQRALVSVDSSIAQQALVGLLSRAIQNASLPSSLLLDTEVSTDTLKVILHYSALSDKDPLDPFLLELLDRLGWQLGKKSVSDQVHSITIRIPRSPMTLLIIDDNLSLLQLMERYLTTYSFRLVLAPSAEKAYQLLDEFTPNGIFLDVMMPDTDGWEVLQRIRAKPERQTIPVVICSVFNDPELAYSLGATVFLPKPFSQDEMLLALSKACLL